MKNIFISGGSSGIGLACVKAFADKESRVIFTYNSGREVAQSVQAQLAENGLETRAFHLDVTDKKELAELRENIHADFGPVNTLICNAGISAYSVFQDIKDDGLQRMMEVNFKGTWNVIQAFVDDMISLKSGRIINISSMWGLLGASCESHYSASKSAVNGLTLSLAKELAPSGITVNAVAPGAIDTNMMSHFSKNDIAQIEEEIPMMRLGAPHEVACAVRFLASEEAAYITGQILCVDGGRTII